MSAPFKSLTQRLNNRKLKPKWHILRKLRNCYRIMKRKLIALKTHSNSYKMKFRLLNRGYKNLNLKYLSLRAKFTLKTKR